MYYPKSAKIMTAVLAALGLVLALARLHSNVAARNTSLPLHLQRYVESKLQASATKANGKIAFTSIRNGFRDIYVMDPDGSNQRQLTFGSVNPADGFRRTGILSPMRSPDGTKIAFTANLEYQSNNLYVMNGDGTRIRRIFSAPVFDIYDITW